MLAKPALSKKRFWAALARNFSSGGGHWGLQKSKRVTQKVWRRQEAEGRREEGEGEGEGEPEEEEQEQEEEEGKSRSSHRV